MLGSEGGLSFVKARVGLHRVHFAPVVMQDSGWENTRLTTNS